MAIVVKFIVSFYFQYNDPVPLTGRSAILGEQRDNYFCDVACGRGKMGDSTYSITKSGLLCEFSVRRMLDKWVELRVSAACLIHCNQFKKVRSWTEVENMM